MVVVVYGETPPFFDGRFVLCLLCFIVSDCCIWFCRTVVAMLAALCPTVVVFLYCDPLRVMPHDCAVAVGMRVIA